MEKDIFNEMLQKTASYQLQTLLSCNTYTQKYGITLSQEDAQLLLASKKSTLKEQERLELGEGILSKLIFAFCDSPYMYQDNFVETIEALQDMFYLYKNESLDELTDDELISYMKEHFDGECQGSLEFLEENCLDEFCKEIRSGCKGFLHREEEDEY